MSRRHTVKVSLDDYELARLDVREENKMRRHSGTSRLLIPLTIAALGLALSACGEGGTSTVTVTDSGASSETSTDFEPEPEREARPQPIEAAKYVERYYRLIDAYRYGIAWPLLPALLRGRRAPIRNPWHGRRELEPTAG
jgi:hypothetical protein